MPEPPLRPEEGVVPVPDAGSAAARVKAALASLGPVAFAAAGNKAGAPRKGKRGAGAGGSGSSGAARSTARAGILDYHAAYMSGGCP